MSVGDIDFAAKRARMVERQLRQRNISNEKILQAMGEVPRERFVPSDLAAQAYDDGPLPIGGGQTISQPWIVAQMIQILEPKETDKVLEIGAGSGYSAAVLSRMVDRVVTIERIADLAAEARARLRGLGYTNIDVIEGDGTLGYPPEAPYDGIIVTAGAPAVPETLKGQLEVGGRLVIPVGSTRSYQTLVRIRRVSEDVFETDPYDPVRFVPLIGSEGWRQ